MSRTRSRVTSAVQPYGDTIAEFGYLGADGHVPSYITAAVPYYYFQVNNVECRYSQYSTIIDQVPLQYLTDVRWKAVDHYSKHPNTFWKDLVYSFSPPTPTLYVRYNWFPSPAISSMPSVNWDSLSENLAVQLEKGSKSDAMAFVTLAEAHKTWQMIRNPLSFLKPNWRRAVKKHPAKTLKEMGTSVWLGYRYGWTPLLGDVESFAKAVAQVSSTSPIPRLLERYSSGSESTESQTNFGGTISSRDFQSLVSTPPANWSVSSGFHWYVKNRTIQTKIQLTCFAESPLRKLSTTLDQLLTATGATGTWRNIRDLCWEVLPFSFVIDWFVDFSSVWRPLNESVIMTRSGKRVGYSIKQTISDSYSAIAGLPRGCSKAGTLWSGKSPVNLISPTIEISSEATRYVRSEGLPSNSTQIFKSKGLSVLRGLDGIALILSARK